MSSLLCKAWQWLLKMFRDLTRAIHEAMEMVVDAALGLVGSIADGVGDLLKKPVVLIGLGVLAYWFLTKDKKKEQEQANTTTREQVESAVKRYYTAGIVS